MICQPENLGELNILGLTNPDVHLKLMHQTYNVSMQSNTRNGMFYVLF